MSRISSFGSLRMPMNAPIVLPGAARAWRKASSPDERRTVTGRSVWMTHAMVPSSIRS
ncbi:MAG: hypothetical protein BWY99_02738 [Synergistetes bacterium ADurb.BinA166]|nr:MAG: hypothetical protein BWY99_02738 [Synergistetes bacterium ADurb.BinA166]